MTIYVLGFRFRHTKGATEVALIKKLKPRWQTGKLNGVGGKVEGLERPNAAMAREFKEETLFHTSPNDWRSFGLLLHGDNIVHLFMSLGDAFLQMPETERPNWYSLADLQSGMFPMMPNLRWLIPMALDKDELTATIHDPSPVPA